MCRSKPRASAGGSSPSIKEEIFSIQTQLIYAIPSLFSDHLLREPALALNSAHAEPMARLAFAKLIQRKVPRHSIKPEARFLRGHRTPGCAMQLQKTLLRQILSERSPAAQQALQEPAKAWIEILKEHGELFVF